MSENELALRLADVAAILESTETDEDSGVLLEDAGGLLSALDYALRGDAGCIEPEEWGARRRAALLEHAEYLGLSENCRTEGSTP